MEVEFAPRFEYGRTQPGLRVDADAVVARGGPVQLRLTSPVPLEVRDGAARGQFVVSAGEQVELRLRYEPAFGGTVALFDRRSRLKEGATIPRSDPLGEFVERCPNT